MFFGSRSWSTTHSRHRLESLERFTVVLGTVRSSARSSTQIRPSRDRIPEESFRFRCVSRFARCVSRFARCVSRFARVGGVLLSGGQMNKSYGSLSSVGSHPRLGAIAPSGLKIENTTLVEPTTQEFRGVSPTARIFRPFGAENRTHDAC